MSDELGDLGEFRHFEEGVRTSLHDQADKISPNHRLGAILDAEAPGTRRTGYWLVGVAALFVLVVALSVGFLLQNRGQTTAGSAAAAPAQNDQAGKQGAVTPEVATPSAAPSSTVTVPWAMPLYQVVTGTSTQPWLLNRIFVSVADPGDRAARAQAAITALLPNGAQTGVYGYQQPWSPDTTAKVTATDTQISIVLNQAGPAGLSTAQQRIAVQSLVWTVTAAAQLNVPVHIEVVGGQAIFATKPAGTYARPDSSSSYTDLVPIWIDTPTPGASVTSPVTVTGQACVFEATVTWDLLQGTTVVTSGHVMATAGCPSFGTYSIPLGSLAPGTYTIRPYEVSAADGSGAYETRVTFTVS